MLRNQKKLNMFKVMSMLTSALYFFLFVSLLLFPESFCNDLGIPGNETAFFLARRASMLMLGFSILLFLSRNSLPSTARQAVACAVGLNMVGFAIMGLYELIRGFVNASIIGAICIEILVAAVFFSFLILDRRQLNKSH